MFYYEDLLLEENDAAVPRSDEVSHGYWLTRRADIAAFDQPTILASGSFLHCGLRWLRESMPELNLPAFDDDELRETIARVMCGMLFV